jgi:hypothetical protein
MQEIRDRFFYKRAKTQPDKASRPPNKFFIFRTMFQGAIDDFKLQVPIVSGLASEVWKKCSPEVIDLFTELSRIAKSEHSEINPGYVYKPNRNKSRNTKCRANSHVQQDLISSSSSPDLNDLPDLSSSFSHTDPIWTNSFDTQDNVFGISTSQASLRSDENSYSLNTTATQNIQTISSQYAYLTTTDSSIHDITPPLETIQNPYIPHYQRQYPLYYSNTITTNTTELSMGQRQLNVSDSSYGQDVYGQDVSALMQPHVSYQQMCLCQTALNHHVNVDDEYIFDSPISENDDSIPFFAEESGCINYSPIFTKLDGFQ